MQDLTGRQKDVLDYIMSYIEERGYAPTLREIGLSLGIRSTNGVNDHLCALERKGYLMRDGEKARALRPMNMMGRSLCLPLVGPVSEGKDPLGADNVWERLCVDRLMVGAGKDLFVVRVGDDCPPCEGLSHGDFLFVRRDGLVIDGELMVLQKGGRMMLARRGLKVRHGGREDEVRLGEESRVLGVVVGYFRKL